MLSSIGTFSGAFQWVSQHGYPFLFIGMVIEGPVLIVASSFAASLGYLNLLIVFILAVLGDLLGDFICYIFGYFSRTMIINRYGHYFGITLERMERTRAFLEKHPLKTLAVIKISPLFPIPSLVIVGSSHISVRRFMGAILMIILPKTILFMVIGYFFGSAYGSITAYFKNGLYALAIIAIAVFIIFYAYRKITAKMSRWLEKK